MRPDERDLDEEIRGHLALSVREREQAGDDPGAARRAALAEFGSVMRARESMRAVWRARWLDLAGALVQDIRVALRSLRHAKALTITVVVTLALGIGANAAVFSVVREVLLRPLVNRDADRLVYIRQSAPGIGAGNMTFSVPEIDDFTSIVTSIERFADFSTIDFTLIGFGEPRVVKAGVVNGSYFEVMGLRPVLGRLLDATDDGPQAEGAAVLTYRFWTSALDGDPSVIGRKIQLGSRMATVVGVLEPSVPYPAETQIIANVVTSPHHLGATMVTGRTHRMTELFGRLAPGATLEAARDQLTSAYAAMKREHPDAYSTAAQMAVTVTPLREQIAAPARTILVLLLAAAGLVFLVACSNVANLMLARAVRREGELAVRAALGAGTGALRRTLLAESLALCGAGAVVGMLLARPLVTVIGRFAGRFSVRALDITVDASVLWVGGALAIAAAVMLAYVPRLPSRHAPGGLGLTSGGVRITPGTRRRLRMFATTQMAFSFVLLAGAGMLLTALVALQTAHTGYDMRHVLALDVPMPIEAAGPTAVEFVERAMRRIQALPGVARVVAGNVVPWRDARTFGPRFQFAVAGYTAANDEEKPYGRLRIVTPGFFGALGIPLLAGRDFTDDDRSDCEPVVIVSQSVARRMFPGGAAVGGRLWWADPYFGRPTPRRIIGVVADADDERVVPGPALTIYHPLRQMQFGDRLFVQAAADPYTLVAPVTRVIREMSPLQPVERAAILADVRAEVLAPERLNAFVLSGFAGVALLIAVVGVAGVLAFSASARSREFGVRLALGSTRRHLLARIVAEGALIAATGIVAGAAGAFAFGLLAADYVEHVQPPGALLVLGAAAVLMGAAVAASLIPAARASRVDVIQALRSE